MRGRAVTTKRANRAHLVKLDCPTYATFMYFSRILNESTQNPRKEIDCLLRDSIIITMFMAFIILNGLAYDIALLLIFISKNVIGPFATCSLQLSVRFRCLCFVLSIFIKFALLGCIFNPLGARWCNG